ncbi:hypothetical protein EJ04DRAFT_608737 [Polyplosphaeria fusca]|uniref:Uncharacterized protein n=1 Tax=Polyplosphaeria fusca TaxID=682080 RepID=A0A9P4QW44_9PLEO|nr:hypothetical protein EJ04DRAFT_608737 [Polyplosphaeria fusca]
MGAEADSVDAAGESGGSRHYHTCLNKRPICLRSCCRRQARDGIRGLAAASVPAMFSSMGVSAAQSLVPCVTHPPMSPTLTPSVTPVSVALQLAPHQENIRTATPYLVASSASQTRAHHLYAQPPIISLPCITDAARVPPHSLCAGPYPIQHLCALRPAPNPAIGDVSHTVHGKPGHSEADRVGAVRVRILACTKATSGNTSSAQCAREIARAVHCNEAPLGPMQRLNAMLGDCWPPARLLQCPGCRS